MDTCNIIREHVFLSICNNLPRDMGLNFVYIDFYLLKKKGLWKNIIVFGGLFCKFWVFIIIEFLYGRINGLIGGGDKEVWFLIIII